MRFTEDDIEAYNEYLEDNKKLKEKLRTAKPKDFQIVGVDGPYPYAVSWAGCEDIAVFKRKADAERFVKTFGESKKRKRP